MTPDEAAKKPDTLFGGKRAGTFTLTEGEKVPYRRLRKVKSRTLLRIFYASGILHDRFGSIVAIAPRAMQARKINKVMPAL